MEKRKFWLRNSIGEEISLNEKTFFHEPQGLGYTLSPKYGDRKYGFFNVTSNKAEPQNQIVGDIVFIGDPYAKYRTLVNWLNKGYTLELVYQPKPSSDKFYRRVEMTSLSKSDKEMYGALLCSVVFTCLTPWYKATPIVIPISEATSNLSRYSLTYDYAYASDSQSGSAEVEADGHTEAAFVVRMSGRVVNPVITLTDIGSGEELGRAEVNCVVETGETFELSTIPNDSHVTANGEDVMNGLNIVYNAFPLIPLARTCRMSVSSESSTSGVLATVSVYNFYRSV